MVLFCGIFDSKFIQFVAWLNIRNLYKYRFVLSSRIFALYAREISICTGCLRTRDNIKQRNKFQNGKSFYLVLFPQI